MRWRDMSERDRIGERPSRGSGRPPRPGCTRVPASATRGLSVDFFGIHHERERFDSRMRGLAHSLVILVALMTVVLPTIAADQRTLVLDIKGMHCAGCASGIEAMLKRVEGVSKADVSYHGAQARVAYDAAKTTPQKIIETIETMGYKATVRK